MKSFTPICAALLTVFTLWTTPLVAQRPDRPDGPPPRPERPDQPAPPEDFRRVSRPDGFRPPPNPVLEAIDSDGDRELSANEIAKASESLKALDRNNDGVLSREELRPRLEGSSRVRRPGPPGDDGDFEFRGRPPGEGGFEFRGRGERGRREGPSRDRPAEASRERFSPAKYADRIMQFEDNEDGKICSDELPDRMRGIIDKGDSNEDGTLSQDELLALAESARPPEPGPGERDGSPRRRRPPPPAGPDIEN